MGLALPLSDCPTGHHITNEAIDMLLAGLSGAGAGQGVRIPARVITCSRCYLKFMVRISQGWSRDSRRG